MDKSHFYYIIDKREQALIPSLETHYATYNIPYFVEHMTIGDIAICYQNKILMIIERKTWTDLAASIKDGRVNNIEKLIGLQKETQCKIAYLLEGDAFPKSDTKYARIPFKNLRSHLDHLMIMQGVFMLYSKNIQGTICRINDLIKSYITSPLLNQLKENTKEEKESKEGGGEDKECDNIKKEPNPLQKKHIVTDLQILISMWKSISCITDNNVHVFIPLGIKNVILGNITLAEISTLKYISGMYIGEKRAKKIIDNAKTITTHINILTSIPGITKSTATNLLNTYSMKNICSNLESTNLESTNLESTNLDAISKNNMGFIQELSQFKKTPKAKLGKVATKMVHLLMM